MRESLKQLLIGFMIGLMLCPPSLVYAAGIQVDTSAPAANQATVDAAQNGVPVVNIAAPGGNGMSHNMFTDFNVSSQGVIINNSVAPGVSQLGGALAQNPNLGGQAASTILNEVTGTGRSSIEGFTEIFGQSATYILANPNGISINGGGFINTPRATMATGTPQFSNGAFQGIDVRGGDILIHGAGVNAADIDAFELVTRATQINADIHAKHLRVITGQNRHNPVTGTTTPLASDGSPAPTVSIDSSALGGMYAGRITLVGTEAGVGVNTKGLVQSTEHLEMTVDGKIQVTNTLTSSGTMALTSQDAIDVSGTVKAAGAATLNAPTVTVAKADPADSPIISGGTLNINAGTLNNEQLIAADTAATIAATTLNNTGTIYSGGTATLRIGDTLYNNRGTILAKSDMVLEGAAAGQRMATLQNDSGTIESLDGGLTFRATAFNNNNSQFTLVEGATELSYSEGGYWHYGNEGDECYGLFIHYIGTPRYGVGNTAHMLTQAQFAAAGVDPSRRVVTKDELLAAIAETDLKLAADPNYLNATEKTALAYARSVANSGRTHIVAGVGSGVVYSATTTQDTATGQELGAIIAAQGNILIEAGDAKNSVSKITSASGDIIINANTFENVGRGIYERTTYKWGNGIFQNHNSPSVIPLGGGTEVALKATDYAYGTLDAGNRVIISSGAVTNGVTERNGIIVPPDPAAQAQKVADVTTLTGALPANGLFQPNANPAHNYLVETNPALTNLDTFYGSDYALSRMGFDPNAEANKRLGDAFFETRLVREQIFELTGRRFFEDTVTSDTAQMIALMDNAVQARTDLNLSVGIALSADQVAALTSDIVWFEYQEVDGQQVLVPVVYLGSASLDRIIQGGSVIVGRDVLIEAAGEVSNHGVMLAANDIEINADTIFNRQGTISGQAVGLTATDSVRVMGGIIKGDTVALKAGNDVVIASDTVEFKDRDTTATQIAMAGRVEAANALSIEAGRDIGILGAEVAAGSDATLKAGGNIAISTMETQTKSATSGSGYNSHSESATNRRSTVTTGGALTVDAGADLAIHGSQIAADNDIALTAGGNVAITAATDSSDLYAHGEGSKGGFFGGKSSFTLEDKNERTVASTLASGGSVTVQAGTGGEGDLAIVGSKLAAAGDMSLKSENELLIASSEEENHSRFEESSSGLLKSKSSKSADGSVTQVASELSSGGVLTAQAKSDVTVSASELHGDQGVTIQSDTGDVRIVGGQNESYSQREESKSGVGLFVSKGRLDIAKFKETAARTDDTGNVASVVTSGQDVAINAANDATVIGSTLAAENDITITAGRDANIIPGRNTHSSQESSKQGGIGIGFSLSENEISISAGYKGVETKTNASGEYNAGSLVSAGNDVTIDAGRNINQISSDVEAGRDVIMQAGQDINVKAAQDLEHLDEYVKTVEVGVKLAAKQSVTTAVRTLANTPAAMTSGEGGAGAGAVTAASGALQAVSAAQQVSNPSVSASLTAGLSMSENTFSSDTATAVASQITAGRDVSLDAGQDLTIEGGRIRAQEDATLTAGRDVAITSAANSQQTASSSSSMSASFGVGATASAVNGMAAGAQVSASASGSESDFRADSNTNAEVSAGQDLTVKSGQDTVVAGANLDGDKVFMDVGGDLTVASRQDTSDSKSSNWSIGGTATVGAGASAGLDIPAQTGDSANIGTGTGSGSIAWVNQQTSIIGREQVDIRVEGNTHVEGAVIAAENGNLKLDTDTLTFQDIHDHDKAENQQASLSGSISAENEKNNERTTGEDGNPYSGTAEGSYSSHDRQQITRATIGEGEIIIRSDPAAGLEGLNRDLVKAQEIVKDEKTSVTVYIDSSAIAEVASGGEGIKENLKKTAEKIKEGKEKLEDLVDAIVELLPDALKEAGEKYVETRNELKALNLSDEQISALYAKGHGDSAALYSVIQKTIRENGGTLTRENADAVLAAILAKDNEQYFGMSASTDNTGKPSQVGLVVGALLTNAVGVAEGMKDLGYDAYDSLVYMTDMVYGSIYQVTGAEVFKANYDRFNSKQLELVQASYFIANNHKDIPAVAVAQYNETMAQYWELKAQGKHIEAGRLIGPACKDIVLAAIGVGAGVKKGAKFFKEVLSKSADDVVSVGVQWSRIPKSLQDQMALEAAKNGAGGPLPLTLADPRYKGMEKWQYVVESNNGKKSVIHYVYDPKTGKRMDFKFKVHSTDTVKPIK